MTTTKTFVIATLALALTAGTARAESVYCDRGKLGDAEAAVRQAQARYQVAQGWGAQNRAIALVAAAGEQLRAAQALCDVTAARSDMPLVNPFEADADPFAPAGHLPTEPLEVDPDMAAWLLVCGDSTAEECAGLATAETTERH
jgi:hypothetical protein